MSNIYKFTGVNRKQNFLIWGEDGFRSIVFGTSVADTWRNNNIIITLKRHRDVVLT